MKFIYFSWFYSFHPIPDPSPSIPHLGKGAWYCYLISTVCYLYFQLERGEISLLILILNEGLKSSPSPSHSFSGARRWGGFRRGEVPSKSRDDIWAWPRYVIFAIIPVLYIFYFKETSVDIPVHPFTPSAKIVSNKDLVIGKRFFYCHIMCG